MEIISSFIDAVGAFVGWLWGIPVLILLIGGGILLTSYRIPFLTRGKTSVRYLQNRGFLLY